MEFWKIIFFNFEIISNLLNFLEKRRTFSHSKLLKKSKDFFLHFKILEQKEGRGFQVLHNFFIVQNQVRKLREEWESVSTNEKKYCVSLGFGKRLSKWKKLINIDTA